MNHPDPCSVVLPDHVVEEIFARLPAKQVSRLRCLSRGWASTLSSDGFEDLHLRAANQNLHGGGPRILCSMENVENGIRIKLVASSLDGPGGAPFLKFPRIVTGQCYPPLISPDMDDDPHYNSSPELMTQPCRGLVILEAVDARLFHVYNPSTGQIATLPEGRTTTGPEPHCDGYYACLGLGYDARTRRHRVVRVHYRGAAGGRLPLPTRTGCEVYEINRSNSEGSWRTIIGAESKPTCWIVNPYNRSVFVHGHCHWLAHRWLRPREDLLLLSFSISDETFGTVPLPPGIRDGTPMRYTCNYDLTELDGRLCIFRRHSAWHEQYDVWLLNGHGSDAAAWDLHCRIDLDRASLQLTKFLFMGRRCGTGFSMAPLAIIDHGRRILLTEHAMTEAICAYTTDTGDTETLIDMSSTIVYLAAVYQESIASPGCQPREDIALMSSSSTQALLAVLHLLPERTHGNLKLVCRSWRCIIGSGIWRHLMHRRNY